MNNFIKNEDNFKIMERNDRLCVIFHRITEVVLG